MTDVLTKSQRSYNMSRIRASNTQLEQDVRKLLSNRGIRGYRLHYRLLGKPDIVFPRIKLAIFLDGCFWHHCSKDFVMPETNNSFWTEKIRGNVQRDFKVNREIKKLGWKVLRFWEHDVRKNPDKVILTIVENLT